MGLTAKKLYKVLRSVGLSKKRILKACTREELFLDTLDSLLLLYYFEREFRVVVKEDDLKTLNTLNQVDLFLQEKVPA